MPNGKNINQITAIDVALRFMEILSKVEFPDDRFYTASHTWIKPEPNLITVGLSSSIIYLFAPIIEFIFLAPPSSVKQNTPCAWAIYRDGILRIRSPIQGELFEINKTLIEHPDIANKDPYNTGWLFKIKTTEKIAGLLTYSEFLEYYNSKIKEFKNEILSTITESFDQVSIPTLQDGGRVIETIKDLLGAKRYFSIINKVFKIC
ncbi:MAG: hypothetical protein NZ923_03715 [Candidatus Kryptonium sp.]|nr:hypothetical protein [Candidatus Kryptonium sp.]